MVLCCAQAFARLLDHVNNMLLNCHLQIKVGAADSWNLFLKNFVSLLLLFFFVFAMDAICKAIGASVEDHRKKYDCIWLGGVCW